jgi:Zn-dependent protease
MRGVFGTDLGVQFRLFGIPVHVSLFFLVIAVLLGQGWTKGDPVRMVAWVLIVFVSVLVHEFGHAFTARSFGQQPFISLHGMGGVTAWRQRGEMKAGRRLLVALAGPMAGVALAFMIAIAGGLFTQRGTAARATVTMIAVVNLFWAVINLIPMIPLDGGNIMAALFDLVVPGKGRQAARYVSIAVALGVGVLALLYGMFVLALVCGLSIWMNFTDLRNAQAVPAPPSPPQVIDVSAEVLPPDEPPRPPDRTA